MADEKDLKIGLEVTTGASQANLEQGIVAPLKQADATGKEAAQGLTASLQQIEATTDGAAEAEQKLVAATEQVAEAGAGAGEGIAAGLGTVTEAAAGAVTAAEEAAAALQETTAAAEGTAAAAQQIGPTISEGFTEVADQAQLVQGAIDRFYQRLADGLAPGRGALRQISAQYAILGQQIAETEGMTAEEAAAAQANYARMGAAIQAVIAKQREFNTGLREAQFGTQEAGQQMMMLGLVAEHIGKAFGETGAEIGGAVGEMGFLAFAAQHLKTAFVGMDLDHFATSWANLKDNMGKAALQAGLVAAVFAGAVAIGTKLADTNEQNAQSVEDLEKAIKSLVSGSGDGEFGAWLGRIQADLQVFVADTINAASAIVGLASAMASGDMAAVAANVAAVREAYSGLSKEVDAAAAAQDKERLASKIAKEAHDALKSSTHDLGAETHTAADEFGKLEDKTSQLSKTTQFYVETQKFGVAGQKLWNQALNEANGSEEKLKEVIDKLQPTLDKLIETYRKAKAEVDLRSDAIKKQIEEEKKLIETEDAESRKIEKLVADIGTEEGARKKLHDTIKGEVDDLAKLDTAHDGTSGSIQEVATRIAELTSRFDDEQPAIDQLTSRLQALAKDTVGLNDETKKHIDAITTEKKSIDDLTQKNKDLQKEEDALVQLGAQMTKADYDRIQAIDHEISSNQIAIQQAKDALATNAQLLVGQAAQTKGTIEITGANGRAVDSQHKLTISTQDATKAAKEAGTGLDAYAKNVQISSDKAKELSDASKGITISVDATASSAQKAVPEIDGIGTGLDGVAKSAHLTKTSIDDVGASIKKSSDSSQSAIDLLKKVAQEEEDAWKKSGIAVDEHKKKIQDLTAQYKALGDQSKTTIQQIIADLQKLDDQTKKTAGTPSSNAAPGSGQYPAPIGPTQGASSTGGGTSGHS